MGKEFGTRVRFLRDKTKYKQEDVSKALGIARSTYAKYETGDSEPDHEMVNKIASFYDVSIDYLLGRDSKSDTQDTLGHAPHENPLGIQLSDEELQLLRDIRDNKDFMLMFRNFAEMDEEERRTFLQVMSMIRK